MELFYPVDLVISTEYNVRLPQEEIAEFQRQFSCNLEYSEDSEVWLDWEQPHEMMRIITDEEFLEAV